MTVKCHRWQSFVGPHDQAFHCGKFYPYIKGEANAGPPNIISIFSETIINEKTLLNSTWDFIVKLWYILQTILPCKFMNTKCLQIVRTTPPGLLPQKVTQQYCFSNRNNQQKNSTATIQDE